MKFVFPEFYSAIFRPVELFRASFCVEIVKGISILWVKTLNFIVLTLESSIFLDIENDMRGNLTLLSMGNI